MRRDTRCRRRVRIASAGALLALASIAAAQQGDVAGEEQPPLPPELQLPPAPVLTPDEALAGFRIEEGFRIEVAAAEPLVEDPVAIAFDADGRMWVVEMRGYMPDVDGRAELNPVGRIVVLTDRDGDGRMDTGRVFMDRLVLPRAVLPVHDGALVIVPPDLLYCRDTSGDGRADSRMRLEEGFGGRDSPEHAGNGLLPGLDNWIHCSQHPVRFRYDGHLLHRQATPGHGQWGITRDDVGRIYYTTNADPLRADLFGLQYASRNPAHPNVVGINERIAHDFRVWPIRPTPGVNRGYREAVLTPEGKLAEFTSACGPVIYRGQTFPATHDGNAFVCEPAAHLVKRYVMREHEGRPVAEPAYERREFLASTDERFRPVNLRVGPDGALYVVDMYRGILQHRIFMTTFLRKQVIARGLDTPVGLGRIYRIVPEDTEPIEPPRLAGAADEDLVDLLAHPGGWWRDTAQRLLVERGARDAAPRLRRLLEAPDPVTRLHALWTLEGVGALTTPDVLAALDDPDPVVRANAVRLAERWIDDERVLEALAARLDDDAPGVRGQLAFSLGEARSGGARALMRRVLTRWADDRQVRSAVVSGLAGRELPFLRGLLLDEAWRDDDPGRRVAVAVIADSILRSDSPQAIAGLLDIAVAARQARWQREVILDRVAAVIQLDSDNPRRLRLARAPRGWEQLVQPAGKEPAVEIARRLDGHLDWLDRLSAPPAAGTSIDKALFERGRRLYGLYCSTCHQVSGRGQPGVAPPLVRTEMTLGSPQRLMRIVMNGMTGPVEVNGQRFDLLMPPAPIYGDEAMAAVLTYVRQSWGNDAEPVTAEQVHGVREATRSRRRPWTWAELSEFQD
ncbi:MAG: c-type cytochrome [Planctomycetes bacterium]|nr:c-type cytochrome [Planctomycetota bacterium]